MRRLAWLLAAPLLVGCSQLDALQQVSGVPLSTVRVAAYDVLVDKKVPIKVAPICTETPEQFTCTGSTLDDEPIEVTVPNDEQQVMTVTVGGEQIFRGPVQDVIEKGGA
jgi:hypothetical protein